MATTPRPTSTRPPLAITRGAEAGVAIPSLLTTHGPKLHSLALRLCRNSADADDMVQDVFLQAFRKWHTFKGNADPGTWLYAIAARSCKARLQRRGGIDKRTPAVSQLMPWRETTVMAVAAAPEGGESPAETREAIAKVQSAIAALPEHLRLPIVLKEVLGLSVEDTASALGLAANTIKTRLHRARLALRKAMIARSPAVPAPAPRYDKQVCLDLLKTKMDLLDRGGPSDSFKVPQAEVCARCRAVFRELDLVHDACSQMGDGPMPPALRASILKAIRPDSGVHAPARQGRRPAVAQRPAL